VESYGDGSTEGVEEGEVELVGIVFELCGEE